MAMDIISKDKKEIQWKGLPRTSLNDIEELKVYSCLTPQFINYYFHQVTELFSIASLIIWLEFTNL